MLVFIVVSRIMIFELGVYMVFVIVVGMVFFFY